MQRHYSLLGRLLGREGAGTKRAALATSGSRSHTMGLASTILLLACVCAWTVSAQTTGPSVTTDRSAYPPGSTVYISGSGVQAGEQVQLQVLRTDIDENSGPEHQPWQVTADDNGNFQTTWFVTSDEVGATLQLTATGLNSGLTAQTTFTDAAKTWVGGASGALNDWNTAANWSPSGVPASGDDVTINSGATYYPILTSGQSFTIHSLTVNSGGTLTINSGGSLTASGGNPIIAGTVNTAGTLDFGGQNLNAAGDTGTINISGGTVTLHDNNTTGMNFNMTGGTLSVNNLQGTRTVTLASDSSGTVTFAPTSLSILTNTSSASFTYTDTKAGTPTIMAASTSPPTISCNRKHRFWV